MTRSPVPVLGFVGPSGSGKTTLLRRLIPVLSARGLRIGYLKHAHHRFDLDRPGKDSYEIRSAGAPQTLLASRERWALQVENRIKGSDPDLWEMLDRFEGGRLDLVLVEGFKHAAYPKIEVHRSAVGEPPLYPQDPDIIAVASDLGLQWQVDGEGGGDERGRPTPLSLDDPEAIADFVLARLQGQGLHTPDPRVELVRYYRWLRRYGYNDSHSGNASVRVGDWFYVTPTGASADRLAPDQLIRCPIEGDCPQGASLDAPLHGAVYLAQPQARALLHSHGAYSVGVSLAGQDFEPIDFEGRYYFERVQVISIAYDRYVAEAPARVAEALARHSIAMVRGHGVYAWGETLDRAYKWTCSLELSAKTSVIARQVAAL
jgi:molybdopterin-guanine dinucleotide biosynthesis protein MobB